MIPSGKRRDLLPVAALIAALAAFWGRMLFCGRIPIVRDPGHLYEDYLSYIPALQCIRGMLGGGALPLWSPFSQAGTVLFADPQYAFTYPVGLACYLFSTRFHFVAVIAAHLALGAVSLYFLARRLRLSPPAAFVASATYGFSFPVVFSFLLINAAWPWHWLPLIMLLAVECLDRGGRRPACALALVWGMQMFTYIQSTYVMLFLLAPFTVLYAFAGGGGEGRGGWAAARRLASIAAAVAGGTLLASALLVPLWEYQAQVSYKAFSFEDAVIFPLPAGHLIESLLSGRPWDSHFAANWTTTFYVGAAGVVLALYSLAFSPRRKLAFLLAAVAAAGVALALGAQTPAYRLFYSWVPGATRFHAPARFLWLLPVTLSLLAGLGMERLASGPRGAGDRLFFAAVLCAVLALRFGRVWGVRPFSAVPVSLSAVRALAPAVLAVAAVAFARLAGRLGGGAAAALLGALAVAEATAGFAYLSFIDFAAKYSTPPAAAFLRARAGLSRFFAYNPRLNNYTAAFPGPDAVPMLYPELSNYFGLYDVQGRGPLRLERYDSLIKGINRRHEMFRERGAYHAIVRNILSPAVDLLGVRYIVCKGELDTPLEVIYEDALEIHAGPGKPASVEAGRPVLASAVVLDSFLEGARGAAQGEVVAQLVLRSNGDEAAVLPVRAGVDTAEVFASPGRGGRAAARHARPLPKDTWEEGDWNGNRLEGARFRGVFELEKPVGFDSVTIRYLRSGGMLAVNGVLFSPAGREELRERMRRRFTPVFRDPAHGIVVYENADALPRAFLAPSAVAAGSPLDALELVLGGADLSRTVVLEEPPPPMGDGGGEGGAGEAEIVDYRPGRVEIRARARARCMLFLSDIWYPGWEASVDGEPAKVYRADYAFRAVHLQPGEHRVVMRFRPKSLAIGGALSLLSLAAIAAVCFRGGRKASPFRGGGRHAP